ncbi:protein BONZAI 3 [Sesamum angolense]|uniref:Protein BONZAI 3 n=1 Tax=Sesamum angolense TaxID=2727404 RepID=A0AAE1WJF6_9LAMI|nr:protein BONZAI 3 [Sesamum angolense]
MGNCFSDVKGGQQAVGGAGGDGSSTAGTGHNDAVDYFFRAKGEVALFTPIELSLSASKLCDRDYISKSDPMAVVYMKRRDGKLEELGRTEVIMNNLDPTWIQKINVTYQFEIVQTLVFRVYDVDTEYHMIPVKMLKLEHQDFLGEASCVVSEIVTKRDRSLTLNLHSRDGRSSRNLGTLTVRAEETVALRNVVEITFRCSDLVNKDLFSKSDPFLRISRIVETGSSIPICKTEVVNNNLNPTWKPLCLTMQQFVSKVNSWQVTPLVIECFDFNSSGNHLMIGKLQKSVAELENLYQSRAGAKIIAPSSGFRHHEKVLRSELFVERFVEKQLYSFLDYISSGFELSFMVAVDFTASNGNPRSPDSLHYIDPLGRLNAYQQVLDADNGRRLESSTGRIATRDIVQFVPMREVHGGQISVVQVLLEELPSQFLTYVRSRDMKPLNV